jgi:hypothetical protein
MSGHRILTAAFAACILVPQALVSQQVAFTLCKDGTKTTATGNVACAQHGGIAVPARDSSAPKATTTITASAPAPAPATPPTAADKAKGDSTGTDLTGAVARCKDRTYSKTRQPSLTCVKHGGVAVWLKPQS